MTIKTNVRDVMLAVKTEEFQLLPPCMNRWDSPIYAEEMHMLFYLIYLIGFWGGLFATSH